MPHRFPYAAIQSSVNLFITGKEDKAAFNRWTSRLINATRERMELNKPKLGKTEQTKYVNEINNQITDATLAITALIVAVGAGQQLTLESDETQDVLKTVNALHGNIPDFGLHKGVNIQVSDRLHPHFEDGAMTPGTKAAFSMTPTRAPKGAAYTSDGGYLVTTDGLKITFDSLSTDEKDLVELFNQGITTIDESLLEEYED